MKRSAADIWFSKCLREAFSYTCERCGIIGRMETSHVYGRRHRTIRWDKENANCLCNGCHRKWHESPLAAFAWFRAKFGEARVELLTEKMNNRQKVSKREEKQISIHYKKQHEIVQDKRVNGETGYIDFVSYQ